MSAFRLNDMKNNGGFFSLDNYLNSVLKCRFSKQNQKYAPYIKSPFEILYSDLINQIRAGKEELRSDQESVQILCKKYAENFGKMDEEYIKEYIEADFYDGGKYIVKIKSDKKYKDSKVKIAVANVRMSDEDILNILNGKNRDISKRCQEIGRILNEAIRYKADILVFPEAYIPLEYLKILQSKAAKHNMVIIGGIEHIMTNGSTWNQSDSAIRSYFIENGLIECVIALPARLFAGTAIATSMIVFSRNNKGVRLVDASELFVEGRRVNELSYENISLIINAAKNDSDISMYVSAEQLRDNDYVLSMNRYIVHYVADGMAFGDVIKRITRGAQLNAKALDEITTTVPTDMQYLMLANIKNGLIDKELPYLKSIDKKNDKYCLSNHSLILSKNGYPYKIAVAEVKEGQRILGNGNLYIIELDEEKADPYYLAAFFGSEQGTAALRSITVGATIPNIGVEQLTKLVIPIPPIEKQKEIADKYKTVKDEITMLQLKLEKAKNRMAHIIEEGGANNA